MVNLSFDASSGHARRAAKKSSSKPFDDSPKDSLAPLGDATGDRLGLVLLDVVETATNSRDFEAGNLITAPVDDRFGHDGTGLERQEELGNLGTQGEPFVKMLRRRSPRRRAHPR